MSLSSLFQISINVTRLRYSVSFLPVARSSATLDYYHAFASGGKISDGRTTVVAMDFGKCNSTFMHSALVTLALSQYL